MARLAGFALALGLLVLGSSQAETPPKLHRFSEPQMGTRFEVRVYAAEEAAAQRAARAAFARVAELDGIMSDYRPASELMRLCQQAGGEPVRVSDDLFTVLARAQDLARRSDGAFDVTIGPVVRQWRRARRALQLPEPEQLARARALVGYQNLRLDEKARTVQLAKPGMLLDLGGIAKGYAADAALAVLKQHGLPRALVAAGGDLAVGDPPPDADAWNVGIAPLENPDAKPKHSLALRNAAVSTSGDAEQYVEIDGKRYSHIVDPRTGLGLVGRMSVTVVARDGTTSDSLATAVCVLGVDRGLALVESIEGASAMIVRKTEKGEETVVSKRFPKSSSTKEHEGTRREYKKEP